MALKDIKDRLKAVLEGVAEIGAVHTRMINVKTAEQENVKLVSGGRMHFWTISRGAARLSDENTNQSFQEQMDTIAIHGFYAVKDADESEGAFDPIVDAVLSAVNTDRRPTVAGGTYLNATVKRAGAPQLRSMGHAEVGPSAVLCHHAIIELDVLARELQA